MYDEDSDGFPSMLSDLGFIAATFAVAALLGYVVIPWCIGVLS